MYKKKTRAVSVLLAATLAFSSFASPLSGVAAETQAVTEAPETVAQLTEAAATEATPTEASATESPATEAPVTEVPATEAPVPEASVTETQVPQTEPVEPVTEETEPATEATEPVTEGTEPMTEPVTETEDLKGAAFYSGFWIGIGYDAGDGILTDTWKEHPVSEGCQLSLYEDGTVLFLYGDEITSGQWVEIPEGVEATFQPYDSLEAYQVIFLYVDGVLVMQDGPGTFQLAKATEGTLTRKAETKYLTAGETYDPMADAEALGYDPESYGINLKASNVDPETPGDYETVYVLLDSRTQKSFELWRPVIVEAAQETNSTEEPGADPATEIGTEEAATEPLTEDKTEEVTESELETESEPETEGVTESETEAVTETESEPETETEAPGEYTKTFRVVTKGGSMRILDPAGKELKELSYGEEDYVVHLPKEELDDVTIELSAEEGYVADSLVIRVVSGGVTVESGASEYGIQKETYSKAQYLAQTKADEVFEASFVKEGDQKLQASNALPLASTGDIDNPKVGDKFTGRATLTSINSPAGHTYNGTGIITCDNGDFEGDSFQMSTCASGHTHAIPLKGQVGTYTLTITGVDKTKGEVSYYIYWANDAESSGYQDLSSTGTYKHNFGARVKVKKTAKGVTESVIQASNQYTLRNAEYTLYKSYKNGKLSGKLGTMVTGSSGNTTSKTAIDVEAGTYYIKETKAPKGFILNEKVYTVKVPAGETKIVNVSDTAKQGTIKVQKVNAETMKPDPQLAGAQFTISSDEAGKKVLETLTVDKNGIATSKNQYDLGITYYVREIYAPDGWYMDSTPKAVVIKDDTSTDKPSVTVTFKNSKEPKGSIEVQKYDAETGLPSPGKNGRYFVGAVYTVYKNAGLTEVAGTITTNEKGYGILTGLDLGDYWVVETHAPEGYTPDLEPHPVKITNENINEPIRVTSDEPPQYGTISIEKRDSVTGTTTPVNGNYSLDGAEYTIYEDSQCTKALETLRITNGKATSERQYSYGDYWVKETKAPANYNIDPKVYTATVNGPVVTIYSADQPKKGSIELQKLDSVTGISTPYNGNYSLDGAVYTVYSDQSLTTPVGSMTVQNGMARLGELYYGTYYVKETQAPKAGYDLDTKVYPVTVDGTSAKVVSTDPIRTGSIKLLKIDAETRTSTPITGAYSMDGAVYTVYRNEGLTDAAGTMTIQNGTATLDGLYYGNYWVKETTAPPYYEADPKVYPVTINDSNYSKPIEVTSVDEPEKAKLAVQKVDAETGKPEPIASNLSFEGAEFGIYSDSQCTNLVEKITTNKDGYAESKGLFLNTYYIKELKAPVGYTLNTDVITITPDQMKAEIDKSGAAAVVVSDVAERVIRANVLLMKYINDGDGSEIQPPDVNLEGIKFIFTYVDDPSIKFNVSGEENTIVTDETGLATTVSEKYPNGTLIYGTWEIDEIPNSAKLEPIEDFRFEVTEDGEVYPYVANNDQVQARIEIQKKDANTGALIPFEGATFKVADSEGEYLTMWDAAQGKYTDTFVTDEKGTVRLPNTLVYGEYSLEEIKAPEGYYLADPVMFTVDEAHRDPLVPLVIECEDQPQLGRIEVSKVDADTNKNAGAGFEFDVIVAEDIKDPAGNVRTGENFTGDIVHLVKGTVVDKLVTDDTGRAVSKNLFLGKYVVVETKAPDYYAVDDTELPAELKLDGKAGKQRTAELPIVSIKVKAKDKKTRIELSKVDSETMQPMEGITFRIFSEEDIKNSKIQEYNEKLDTYKKQQVKEYDSLLTSQKKAYEELLKTQEEALKAYKEEGHTDEEIQAFIEKQEKTLELTLVDFQNAQEALLEQQEKDLDAYIKELRGSLGIDLSSLGKEYTTDSKGYILMENLKHDMHYYIKETKTLPGYNLDPTIHVVYVDEDGLIDGKDHYELVISNVANVLQITKTDITGEKELPGAKLTITNADGEIVDTWVSDGTPHVIKGITAENYILTELIAPEGYAKAESIQFTVTDSLEVQTVQMKDELIQVEFLKLDADTKEPVAGAKLVVRNEAGKTVEEWTTDGTPYRVNLPKGNYTLTEVETPDGYATAESVAFTVTDEPGIQTITMEDTPLELVVVKAAEEPEEAEEPETPSETEETDEPETPAEPEETESEPETAEGIPVSVSSGESDPYEGITFLPGAVLQLLDAEGNEIEVWTSTETPHTIKYLKKGTYTLREIYAPEGYAKAEDITFELTDSLDPLVIVMEDKKIRVEVLKVDKDTQEPVSGAKLAVTDADGELVEEWVTDGTPHELIIPAGDYTLTETETPDGYATAKSIPFTVTDQMETQTITMEDKPLEIEVSKTAEDGKEGVELPGATLQLLDSEGNEVETWETTDKPHRIKYLHQGMYTLRELAAPEGYARAEDITFEVVDSLKIQRVKLVNERIQVEFLKLDEKNGEPVSGAKLAIHDAKGKIVEEWVTDGMPHRMNLPKGDYTLTETETPDGYATAETVSFTVTDELGVQTVTMEDTPIELVISKQAEDGEEGKELPGVMLRLLDENGTEVETWTTTEEPHTIQYLPAGIYTLQEISAPEGYSLAKDIRFRLADTRKVQYITMTNTLTQVEVSKKDITGEKELPGAELVVKNKDGEEVDRWTSTEEPHLIKGLPAGEYTLTETKAPDGYVTAETITFTVTDTLEIQRVEMKDEVTKVEISKKDITNNKELPGAELVITDSEGKEIEKWTSTEEPHYIEMLPIGTYTLTETAAPEGYAKAESVTFTVTDTKEIQTVEMFDDVTKVDISKTDITGKEELPGAELIVKNQDGEEIDRWKSTEEPHRIEKLPAGKYTLTELTAPEGYAKAESIPFTVTDSLEIQKVKMKDKPLTIEIIKKDLVTSKPLAGAKLELKDSKGRTVEEWTTDQKPHRLSKVPAGDYTLVEVEAPDGYELAEELHITIEDTEETQTFTMYDKPKEGTTSLTAKRTKTMPGSPASSPTSTKPVKTGDTTRLLPYLLLLGAALAVMGGYILYRRRRNNQTKK